MYVDYTTGIGSGEGRLYLAHKSCQYHEVYLFHLQYLYDGVCFAPYLFGKGVCGTAWKECRTLVVANVEQFPGHIACSSLSKSEVVVPVYRNGEIVGVLDIDSAELAKFDDTDACWLKQIVALLSSDN